MSDPQFPDRPDTPDFRRMSEAVLEMDDDARTLPSDELVGADFASLSYMAEQRVHRAAVAAMGRALIIRAVGTEDDMNRLQQTTQLSIFLDGFELGRRFQERGGRQQF